MPLKEDILTLKKKKKNSTIIWGYKITLNHPKRAVYTEEA